MAKAIPTYGGRQGPDQDSIEDGQITSPSPEWVPSVSIPVNPNAQESLVADVRPAPQRISARVALVLRLAADRRERQ